MPSKNKKNGRLEENWWLHYFAKLFGLIPRMVNRETGLVNDWQIARSEDVSQHLDNMGIDIYFKQNNKFAVQVKQTTTNAKKSKPIDIQPLEEIQCSGNQMPILCTGVYRKTEKSRRSYGKYVTLKAEDFEELLKRTINNNHVKEE